MSALEGQTDRLRLPLLELLTEPIIHLGGCGYPPLGLAQGRQGLVSRRELADGDQLQQVPDIRECYNVTVLISKTRRPFFNEFKAVLETRVNLKGLGWIRLDMECLIYYL